MLRLTGRCGHDGITERIVKSEHESPRHNTLSTCSHDRKCWHRQSEDESSRHHKQRQFTVRGDFEISGQQTLEWCKDACAGVGRCVTSL